MRKSKKLLSLTFAVLVSVTMFVSGLSLKLNAQENEGDNTVSITIHKRLFNDKPTDKENTGDIMDDFGGEALNGAEFTVYNVTEEYNQGLNSKTVAEVTNDLVKKFDGNYEENPITSGITKNDGTVSFDLNRKSDGQMQVYVIVETKLPTNISITEKSSPMIIALPIYSVDVEGNSSVENKNIHLYPKNVSPINTKTFFEKGLISDIDSTGGFKDYSIDANQILDYEVKLHIPHNFEVGFKYIDIHNALELHGDITIEGLKKDEDYKVNTSNNQFTINFITESESVKNSMGKTLTIKYQMKLASGFEIDTFYSNKGYTQIGVDENDKVEVAYKVNEEDKNARFYTSGHQFLKVDGRTNKELAGADFIIKNGEKYATFNIDFEFIGWVTEIDQATRLSSSSDGSNLGHFFFKGLKRGDYKIEEVVSPDGYVLMDDLVFNVSDNKTETYVKNFKKGILPSTGGKGIFGFLSFGAVLMGGSYIMLRKSKDKSES